MGHQCMLGGSRQDRISIIRDFTESASKPVKFVYPSGVNRHYGWVQDWGQFKGEHYTDCYSEQEVYDGKKELESDGADGRIVVLHEINEIELRNFEELLAQARAKNIEVIITLDSLDDVDTQTRNAIENNCSGIHRDSPLNS